MALGYVCHPQVPRRRVRDDFLDEDEDEERFDEGVCVSEEGGGGGGALNCNVPMIGTRHTVR